MKQKNLGGITVNTCQGLIFLFLPMVGVGDLFPRVSSPETKNKDVIK